MGEEKMITIEEVVKLWDEEHPNMQIEAQGYGRQKGKKVREGMMFNRLNKEAVIKLSEDFDFEPWGNRTCYVFGFNYNNENVLNEIYIRFERRIIKHPNTNSLYIELKSIKEKAESKLEKFTVSRGRKNPNHLFLEMELELSSSKEFICARMKELIDLTREEICNFLTGTQEQEGEQQEEEQLEGEQQEEKQQEEEELERREQQERDRLKKILVKHEVKDEKQREMCKEIHDITKSILKELIIEGKDLGSLKAAYYTKKEIAENLLIGDTLCGFRLYYTSEMNDPSEGEVLLNFLEIKNENRAELPENIPFIACFSLEENSLNQFRLYGKEGDNEATGVSIVFGCSFFENCELYRCVYIDREERFKVSFSKEENYDKTKEEEIEKHFKKLKELCEKSKEYIKPKLLADLLIKIIYLVKDSAFEEERECRIVDLKDKKFDSIKIDKNRLYIIKENAKEIIDHIEYIYFAPLAEGMEAFEIKTGVKKCYRSLHPYRGKNLLSKPRCPLLSEQK